MIMLHAMVIVFAALTIYLVCDAYVKNAELKKFKTGIIIAVVLMGLTIVVTAVSLMLSLNV